MRFSMQALLTIAFSTIASAALAHPSLVPHDHPHGSSLLPDAATLLLGAALVLGGVVLVRFLRRR
jgi:hypothetical protein